MAEKPVSAESLWLVGLSHRSAPVALRERLAFRSGDLLQALAELLARDCREAAILSTCNRVEIVAVARDEPGRLGERLRLFLSEHHRVPAAELEGPLYQFSGVAAVRHLFEVVASLDSLILGETEILAQSKEAYRLAAEFGACGPYLRGVFERAFFLAKEIREEGGLARSQASVSSAAVLLAQKVFALRGKKVLLIGTGEMARGIIRALKAAGVQETLVISRTEARAEEFARNEGGRAGRMADLPELLAAVDIVLVSAASPTYLVGPLQVQSVLGRRHGRSLCLIDISVPRNVDPAVSRLDDVFLYDIDDLEQVASEGRREREEVAERWRPRLAGEAEATLLGLLDLNTAAAARHLIAHCAALRQEVLEQSRAAGLDPAAAAELDRALERLQARLLHAPLQALKEAARAGDGADASAWIGRLFRLPHPAVLKMDTALPPGTPKESLQRNS